MGLLSTSGSRIGRLRRIERVDGIRGRDGHHDGQALVGDLLHDAVARLEPVEPAQVIRNQVDRVCFDLGRRAAQAFRHVHGKGRGIGIGRAVVAHPRRHVHQAVAGNAGALRDGVVVEIMRAGDLHRAGAEIGVGVVVGDDRDQAAVFLRSDGDLAELAHDRRIAFVGGVHRHGAVAQHCLGPRCGDGDVVADFAQRDVAVCVLLDILIGRPLPFHGGERVLEMPHVAWRLDILDLEVGDRGLEMRVPVHQPLAAVDQTLAIHLDEDLDDRVVEIALFALRRLRCAGHGEGFARPVAASSRGSSIVL